MALFSNTLWGGGGISFSGLWLNSSKPPSSHCCSSAPQSIEAHPVPGTLWPCLASLLVETELIQDVSLQEPWIASSAETSGWWLKAQTGSEGARSTDLGLGPSWKTRSRSHTSLLFQVSSLSPLPTPLCLLFLPSLAHSTTIFPHKPYLLLRSPPSEKCCTRENPGILPDCLSPRSPVPSGMRQHSTWSWKFRATLTVPCCGLYLLDNPP